jgi:GNAT superfamily N-acetyltransferase
VEVHPLTPDRLGDLADLFDSAAVTRHCWCRWFMASAGEVKAGWDNGGNRRAFEAVAQTAKPPLGMLAYEEGVPVGWLATGPRSRYPRAIGPRTTLMRGRDRSEDDEVWLLPCFFVRPGHRAMGVTSALLAAAVEQAEAHGAPAIEGFPIAEGQTKSADDFLGKERRFVECGFSCVAAPSPRRVIMRRELQ